MSKTSNLIQITLFMAFIFIFFILILAIPDVVFSEQENRELAQAPEFSLENLFSGKFTEKFESYATDQFPMRDNWIEVKARSELLIGKKENKGVFLCKSNTLIERYKAPDSNQLRTNIDAVRTLSENADVPVYFALIPGASEIHCNLLPKNAPNDSQKDVIDFCYENSGAVNIDMYSALKSHSDEYIFYRTDHHWTSLGAYYGYTTLMDTMGLAVSPLSSFDRRTVTEKFYGTVYSKSGINWVNPDTIEIFAEQDTSTTVMNYSEGAPVKSTLYDYDYLDKKDKYSMFMGGITPLITVETGNTDAPSLLVVRDSYTDSLVPFLQGSFSKIYIMDLRYYKTQLMQSSIQNYIKDNSIDQVLVCYSVFNFGTDTNVFLLGL